VRDLAVTAIADDRWREQGRRLTPLDPWQELRKPAREQRGMRTRHAQRLGQRWRQELVAARFPGPTVTVAAEPVERAVTNLRCKHRIEPVSPLKRQDHREAGVEMRAHPDRVRHDVEIRPKPPGKRPHQWFELGCPILFVAGCFELQIQ